MSVVQHHIHIKAPIGSTEDLGKAVLAALRPRGRQIPRDQPNFEVSDELHVALVRRGWTPPPEDP